MVNSFSLQEWKYIHSLIDRSEFKTALAFFTKAKLPSAEKAPLDDLYFMEAFARLLFAQGFQKRALVILQKVIDRTIGFGDDATPLLARLLILKGQCLPSIENSLLSYPIYQQAYNLLENRTNNQSEFGWIYLGYSQIGELVRDWELYLDNAVDCFRRSEDKIGEAAALNAYGVFHGKMLDRDQSKSYLDKALEISQQAHDVRRTAGCMNNIAVFYYFQGNEEEQQIGVNLLNEAIRISRRIESWEFLSQHHRALGIYYQNRQKSESTLQFQKVFEIAEKRQLVNPEQREKYLHLVNKNQVPAIG